MLFTGPQPQQPLPEATCDKYVALVSGLSVGGEAGEPARVALLVDYLAGLLGGLPEQEQVAKVCSSLLLKCLNTIAFDSPCTSRMLYALDGPWTSDFILVWLCLPSNMASIEAFASRCCVANQEAWDE